MRKSGILLHIASLPNKYGIGTMGREAYKFVDWLRSAGQSLWQILPLSQTSFGDSPYQSFSAYAGNPYFIDPELLIADGLRGTDEVEVPVPNGEYCKTAKIGRAIMDADIFISLTHFKGHESTGFGGTLKNIGMGCGSRAGKMEQHAAGKPAVQEGLCRGCHRCAKECGSDAITYNQQNKAVIDYDKCKGCGMCAQKCPKHIILFPLKDDPNPPKPVVKPAAPAAAPAAKPEAKAEAKPETKAE